MVRRAPGPTRFEACPSGPESGICSAASNNGGRARRKAFCPVRAVCSSRPQLWSNPWPRPGIGSRAQPRGSFLPCGPAEARLRWRCFGWQPPAWGANQKPLYEQVESSQNPLPRRAPVLFIALRERHARPRRPRRHSPRWPMANCRRQHGISADAIRAPGVGARSGG